MAKTKNKTITLQTLNDAIESLAVKTADGFQKVDQQIEDLATMTARGFRDVDKRFEAVDKRFEIVDKRLDKIEARLTKIEDDIELLNNRLYQYFDLSDKRYLELKRRDLIVTKWVQAIAKKTGVAIDTEELEKF